MAFKPTTTSRELQTPVRDTAAGSKADAITPCPPAPKFKAAVLDRTTKGSKQSSFLLNGVIKRSGPDSLPLNQTHPKMVLGAPFHEAKTEIARKISEGDSVFLVNLLTDILANNGRAIDLAEKARAAEASSPEAGSGKTSPGNTVSSRTSPTTVAGSPGAGCGTSTLSRKQQLVEMMRTGEIDANTMKSATGIAHHAMQSYTGQLSDQFYRSLTINDLQPSITGGQAPNSNFANGRATAPRMQVAVDDHTQATEFEGHAVLIQAGAFGDDFDTHRATFMNPQVQSEALHACVFYAQRFGPIKAARMHTMPARSGRKVVMVEVLYKTAEQARNAIEMNRRTSPHGVTSTEIRATLPDGHLLFGKFQVWASEVDDMIFSARGLHELGSSVDEDMRGNYTAGMRRRFLGNGVGPADFGLHEDALMLLAPDHKESINFPIGNMRHLHHHNNNSGRQDRKDEPAMRLYTYDILNGTDVRSTVMFKNIPEDVTAYDVNDFMQWACKGLYDYTYLRVQFDTKRNPLGYGFANFTDAANIVPFAFALSFKRWGRQGRQAGLSYASYQGRDALINRFRNSAVMDQGWDSIPHLWYPHGSPNVGMEEPFPPVNNEMKKRNSQKNVLNGLFDPFGHRRNRQSDEAARGRHMPQHNMHPGNMYANMSPVNVSPTSMYPQNVHPQHVHPQTVHPGNMHMTPHHNSGMAGAVGQHANFNGWNGHYSGANTYRTTFGSTTPSPTAPTPQPTSGRRLSPTAPEYQPLSMRQQGPSLTEPVTMFDYAFWCTANGFPMLPSGPAQQPQLAQTGTQQGGSAQAGTLDNSTWGQRLADARNNNAQAQPWNAAPGGYRNNGAQGGYRNKSKSSGGSPQAQAGQQQGQGSRSRSGGSKGSKGKNRGGRRGRRN